MRVFLIAALLLSCSNGNYFEVRKASTNPRRDLAMCLSGLGWRIDKATNRFVETEWHRFRLKQSPLHVREVQVRISANLARGTISGLCTQRTMRADGAGEIWHFRPCTDARALRMIDNATRICGE
jgi:hypothetical protein